MVLSAGALLSPQLLMLSGVGPAAHLQQHGIPVRHHLPGVGQNLHDHTAVPLVWHTKDTTDVAEFNNLVNFPGHMSNKPCPNMPDGMRCCVMCGQACPTSTSGKITKKVSSYIGGSDRLASLP